MSVKIVTSKLHDLKQSSTYFEKAEKLQIKGTQGLYAYFVDGSIKTDAGEKCRQMIEDEYNRLRKTNENIPKTKHFSNQINWASGLTSKQDVSDCSTLMRGAKEEEISVEDFPKWIEKHGGKRATLNYLRSKKRSHSEKETDIQRRISQAGKSLAAAVFEHGKMIKSSKENPCGLGLNEDEIVLKITKKDQYGNYFEALVKLTHDDCLYFPKTKVEKSATPKLDPKSDLDKLIEAAETFEADEVKQAVNA